MSELAKRHLAGKAKLQNGRRTDLPRDDELPPDEANALKKLQREAERQGCLLSSGGKGGLPPSLVWHVFRRDAKEAPDGGMRFVCKVCGEQGTEENGGLGVHHKFQHITDPTARAKGMLANQQGRRNDPSQMIVICAKDHDKVHQRDRAEHGGKDADEMAEGD